MLMCYFCHMLGMIYAALGAGLLLLFSLFMGLVAVQVTLTLPLTLTLTLTLLSLHGARRRAGHPTLNPNPCRSPYA